MKTENFLFKDKENVEIHVYKWIPNDGKSSKGIIQIAHGMAETAERYERFAEVLTNSGYIVYANDHRGHGKTAKTIENLGYLGQDGFNWMVENLKQLNDIIKTENPGLPVYLLGHSMGSFLTQSYITKYGDSLKGAILSGTAGPQGSLLNIASFISKMEVLRIGPKTTSNLMDKLSFGNYNNYFKPVRTEFDWLSRDVQEVDAYINNPFCGTIFTASFFRDLIKGLKDIHVNKNMKNIPKELPIYIFSGDKDPVSKNGTTIKSLIKIYETLGIKDVSCKLYKDGRHEMLNEINRNEVMEDTLTWLNAH